MCDLSTSSVWFNRLAVGLKVCVCWCVITRGGLTLSGSLVRIRVDLSFYSVRIRSSFVGHSVFGLGHSESTSNSTYSRLSWRYTLQFILMFHLDYYMSTPSLRLTVCRLDEFLFQQFALYHIHEISNHFVIYIQT